MGHHLNRTLPPRTTIFVHARRPREWRRVGGILAFAGHRPPRPSHLLFAATQPLVLLCPLRPFRSASCLCTTFARLFPADPRFLRVNRQRTPSRQPQTCPAAR